MPGLEHTALDLERLGRLLAGVRSVVGASGVDAIHERVLALARELTGARYAAIGVLSEDGRSLAEFVTSGIDDKTRAAIGRPPTGGGVLGTLIRDPRALRIDDIGRHPQSYGFPEGHPEMTTFLGVPIDAGDKRYANLYLTERDGGPFTEADEHVIAMLAEWAGTAVDTERRYRAEHDRRLELEFTVRGLEATIDITQAVGGETDLARVLELICKRSRALVSARFVLILLANPDRTAQTIVAVAGDGDQRAIGTEIPVEDSLTGRTLVSAEPVHASGLPAVIRRYGLDDRLAANVGLMVPLIYRGTALGVLGAYDRVDGTTFSSAHEHLLEAFAANAAIAVATAQNVAHEGLVRGVEVLEAERARIAESAGASSDAVADLDRAIAGLRHVIAGTYPVDVPAPNP